MSTDLLVRVGKSKMEKLQESFVMTDKETGLEIIKKYGSEAFTMWWYLESRCYGKDKVMTFPKNETIQEDLGIKTIRTVQRWLKKLEDINAIKRVKIFNTKGAQTNNLIIVNASFPQIPEGWDELYKYGAYQFKYKEYIALNGKDDKPWTKMSGAIDQGFEDSEDEKTQENSPRQKCHGQEIAHDKNVRGGMTKMSGGVGDETPYTTRDDRSFSEVEEDFDFKKTYLPNIYIDNDHAPKKEFHFYNWLNKK